MTYRHTTYHKVTHMQLLVITYNYRITEYNAEVFMMSPYSIIPLANNLLQALWIIIWLNDNRHTSHLRFLGQFYDKLLILFYFKDKLRDESCLPKDLWFHEQWVSFLLLLLGTTLIFLPGLQDMSHMSQHKHTFILGFFLSFFIYDNGNKSEVCI